MSQPSSPPIYCPNPLCQAANPRQLSACQRCQTFIPHRFLWALGAEADKLTGLLADRYAVMPHEQQSGGLVVLDTKPGYLPDFPTQIPAEALPYMALFGWRNHIPQPYGMARLSDEPGAEGGESAILLLEQAAIYPAEANDPAGLPIGGTLMPKLLDHWSIGNDRQRLHWLWQIVQLWQVFGQQPSRATLVNPSLLRLDGQRLKVLELQTDIDTVTLTELAYFWATRPVQQTGKLWQQLSHAMIQGEIESGEQLLAILDQALSKMSHLDPVAYDWATQTDQGPGRPYNEDFCYPPPQLSEHSTRQITQPPTESVELEGDAKNRFPNSPTFKAVIVCDGIGGHDGGDVASKLAVGTIFERFNTADLLSYTTAQQLTGFLEDAVLIANDAIADRNDHENRKERQRMGTTLVMTLVLDNQLYLTHVGDSRAYRITLNGCTQLTLDDDVASRDTRLGNGFYRDSCQYSGAGSLTQALGMVQAEWLNPTTQRFILDEDCLFLLCSDGLSDFDRLEECWAEELKPVLLGQRNLQTTVDRLVEIANTRNGHDNVTIGLVHIKAPSPESGPLDFPLDAVYSPAALGALPDSLPVPAATQVAVLPSRRQVPVASRSAAAPPARRRSSPLIWLFGLGAIGFGLWWIWTSWFPKDPPIGGVSLGPAPSLTASPTASPTASTPVVEATLVADRLIKVIGPGPYILLPQPGKLTPTAGTLPSGAILKVIGRQTLPDRPTWVKLQVCTVPPTASPNASPTSGQSPGLAAGSPLPPGASGWVEEATILPFTSPNLRLTPDEQKACSVGITPAAPVTPASPAASAVPR